ncbi:preprotein translocase subunit YajC [Flaviflexus salsibiostraticola]|uniref:Preprotein translocase subunit YajC n=1 Tax=Flaviflexus salsibiostraticola TaxID=1282737 RepID=A0A3Q8WSH1_9ACTO|nr:preprotein translocase subunit YajC [Flaviflexus salsibiostraticola]AZN29199.1 preprotein translocase subunit YajC [Flaviflexus salsibiostraticola]
MELVILVAIFGGFMFMMSRANKKMASRVAEQRESALEIGNTVVTGSGMIGTIVEIDGGVVTIESASGDETQWLTTSVSSVIEPPYEHAYEAEESDEAEPFDGLTPRDSDIDRDR